MHRVFKLRFFLGSVKKGFLKIFKGVESKTVFLFGVTVIFKRFEERGLSHYSYAVGCEEKEQIAIIDPRRDVEIYLEYAEENRYVISHVFETHIHADYASGARELAKRCRATLALSGYDQGGEYEVSFSCKKCFEGDVFRSGSIELKVLHTPGHTPEHISLLVYDLKTAKETPIAIFSGDFLLYGGVGRPDLLGEANTQQQTRQIYECIHEKIHPLPDELEIFPAHGPGSFCGLAGSSRTSSKLKIEKLSNPFLAPGLSEKDFVEKLVSFNIPYPPYFKRIKEYNSSDKRFEVPTPTSLEVMDLKNEIDLGAVCIDLRDQSLFGQGHIPQSICIGAGAKVGFWASWSVPYNRPIVLITDDPAHIKEALHSLARVGFDRILGYLKGGFETWKRAGLPTSCIGECSPQEMIKTLESDLEIELIDVRTDAEWNMGHISGARHISCFELPEKIESMPKKRVVFVCAGGYRSIWAASLAKRAGYELISHIPGGMHAWQRAGLSVIST